MSAVVVAFPLDRVKRMPAAIGDGRGHVPAERPEPEIFSRFVNEDGMRLTELEVADWCRRHGLHVLTARQAEFIEQICRTLHHRPLTERQSAWLNALVDRVRRAYDGGSAA
jgi:hypothetical protein